jgi:DNA-binding NarL/FixJ family response regulator
MREVIFMTDKILAAELEVDAATLAAEFAAQKRMDWFEVDAEIIFFRRFGFRDRAIAARLKISTQTVRSHDKERAQRFAERQAAAAAEIEELP